MEPSSTRMSSIGGRVWAMTLPVHGLAEEAAAVVDGDDRGNGGLGSLRH